VVMRRHAGLQEVKDRCRAEKGEKSHASPNCCAAFLQRCSRTVDRVTTRGGVLQSSTSYMVFGKLLVPQILPPCHLSQTDVGGD
jgi:hypothetical protein